MFAEWIVGLLAALIATPVAIASYVSARRADAEEHHPPHFIHKPLRASAPAENRAAHQRHVRRRMAA